MAKRRNPRRRPPVGKQHAPQPWQVRKGAPYPANTPAPISQALVSQGMDLSGDLGPGRPLEPYWGYSRRPRAQDYPTGVNISTQSRASWGRASYQVLRGIIEAYDVARMCINHKIDELRSMPPLFEAAPGVTGDVDGAIDAARAALEFPDRQLPYDAWLSKWLENALRYDAAPLYRRRNMAGEVIGLEVLDGTTISPYIDENGRRPEAPAPAYYQVIHGIVGDWYTSEDIEYVPFRPQSDPFGLAPIESILLTANTDIRFQWHFLQLFTDGSVPAGFMELPPDVSSPDQVAEWQDYWDATVMGDQAKLHQLLAVPNGSKFTETRPTAFDPKFPQYLMSRTAAAFGVVPQDLGLVQDVNRANGETQVDIQFRVNTLPWVRYVEGHLCRYVQRDLGLPVRVALDTGRDVEDRVSEAQAWKIYVEMGAASSDEPRSKVLGLPVDQERPTPRFIQNTRLGPIPLIALEGVAGVTDPETYGPAASQPPLDQPYVGPIGVIPQAGTTDQQRSLAAVDAYQVQARHEIDAAEQATDTAPVLAVKTADLTGAEAEELAAFRRFAKARRKAGTWRDFQFAAVDAETARSLNEAERLAVLKATGEAGGADPKARTPASVKDWPGWSKDRESARLGAGRIAAAMRDALDARAIAETWLAQHGTGTVSKAAGDDDADDERKAIADALKQAVSDLWSEGYLIGSRSAVSLVTRELVDWSNWTPGDADAARLLVGEDGDGSGLAQLLDQADVTISSIAEGRLDALGRLLAEGANNGWSVDALARKIAGLLEDPAWAELVAVTELNRAISAATLETYQANGIAGKEWLSAEDGRVCPTCEDNEDAGPIPLGDAFPSGDTAPPGHPRCRCALGPAVLTTAQGGE